MEQIFVSSVQKELQADRYAVRDFVHGNELLGRFFQVFLFEDLPPTDRRADEVYLDEVAKSRVYIGLFGNEYGWEDDDGLSPTEKEFDFAAKQHKRRFIFVRGYDDKKRHPKMKKLIRKADNEVVRRRYADADEMLRLLYGSLVRYLQDQGVIATVDFDASPCPGVTLKDISVKKLRWFLEMAREERGYALSAGTPRKKALAHLNLLAKSVPTKGAVLLFGNAPERHIHSAEITCLHFQGTAIEKPISSQQVYHGTLFELVDQAVDFVMARIARSVEPSSVSPESRVRYEVPYRAIREAIVNAVAHRNYASRSGVQVMVFVDRIEVWNPGGLPEDLTVGQLHGPHPSVPRNRLLCEPLFLAHYIERAGTGTLDMIRLCAEAGLPEPKFLNEGERFRLIIWRDWLTDAVMDKLRLSDRQKIAVGIARRTGRVTNREYKKVTGVSDRTVLRDLNDLVNKGIFQKVGITGRKTHYVLSHHTRQKPDKPDAGN